MLIDSRQLQLDSKLETSVCIVGGGPAGLTLALELAKQGIAVSVFESGPLHLDEATLNLNDGESIGLPYEFSYGHRSRYLGGGSNCWGGFCRPWDTWDFEQRPWVDDSGWPISMETLAPYYRRAHSLLKVGADDFSAESWQNVSNGALQRFKVDPEKLREVMTLFSPPLKFGHEFKATLATSSLIRVYLWANITHIDTEPMSGRVSRVELRTLSGNRFFASAQQYVLATGGIENARILLNSNRSNPNGVGNSHDLVGRYFMDHPRLMSGEVEFKPEYRNNPFYDLKFFCISDSVRVNGIRVSGQFALPYEIQRDEGLLNSQVWLRSLYPGETTETIQSLFRMRLRAARRYAFGHLLGHDLAELARHPVTAGLFAAAHITGSRSMVQRVVMEAIVEPEPLASSRVMLSNERDALGLRRAQIDWRLSDKVKRTFDRSFESLGSQLQDAGIAKVKSGPKFADNPWPSEMIGTWHHMGTTRMHDSPRKGVVDRDCRVHGIKNLFIAGSSVFPTSSSNYPTITLVALALRLSERLASELRVPALKERRVAETESSGHHD
jgi:choline dehydrogenase-like flavoprotein